MAMDQYMLRVTGCCCCFNLRTGTLILLWLSLFAAISNIFENGGKTLRISNSVRDPATKFVFAIFALYYAMHMVFMVIIPCVLGLYGIFKRRPSFLKPYIYVGVFEIVGIIMACLLVFLVAIFYGSLIESIMTELIKGADEKVPQKMGAAVGLVAFLTILILVIAGLFQWYFLSVVYRYHKQFVGETQTYHRGQYSAP